MVRLPRGKEELLHQGLVPGTPEQFGVPVIPFLRRQSRSILMWSRRCCCTSVTCPRPAEFASARSSPSMRQISKRFVIDIQELGEVLQDEVQHPYHMHWFSVTVKAWLERCDWSSFKGRTEIVFFPSCSFRKVCFRASSDWHTFLTLWSFCIDPASTSLANLFCHQLILLGVVVNALPRIADYVQKVAVCA